MYIICGNVGAVKLALHLSSVFNWTSCTHKNMHTHTHTNAYTHVPSTSSGYWLSKFQVLYHIWYLSGLVMELHVKHITFYYTHTRMTVKAGIWDPQPNVKCSHNEIKF